MYLMSLVEPLAATAVQGSVSLRIRVDQVTPPVESNVKLSPTPNGIVPLMILNLIFEFSYH